MALGLLTFFFLMQVLPCINLVVPDQPSGDVLLPCVGGDVDGGLGVRPHDEHQCGKGDGDESFHGGEALDLDLDLRYFRPQPFEFISQLIARGLNLPLKHAEARNKRAGFRRGLFERACERVPQPPLDCPQ